MEGREDRLLTVAEVAEYFRVEPESVRRWLREGKLLGINLGRGPGWRIRLGDLELFIAERQVNLFHFGIATVTVSGLTPEPRVLSLERPVNLRVIVSTALAERFPRLGSWRILPVTGNAG